MTHKICLVYDILAKQPFRFDLPQDSTKSSKRKFKSVFRIILTNHLLAGDGDHSRLVSNLFHLQVTRRIYARPKWRQSIKFHLRDNIISAARLTPIVFKVTIKVQDRPVWEPIIKERP